MPRYVRPSSFVMMKALDPTLFTKQPQAQAPSPPPKATRAQRRALMDKLVTESNNQTVLGHLHPRRLRKDYE